MKRITATAASRSFADLLDRVERRREAYVVERRGKRIAEIVPARTSSGAGSTVADLLDAVAMSPGPDRHFLDDLRRIRRSQGKPRDPWASSSTRRT